MAKINRVPVVIGEEVAALYVFKKGNKLLKWYPRVVLPEERREETCMLIREENLVKAKQELNEEIVQK